MQTIDLTSTLTTLPMRNKRVFLRADLNVPVNNGKIINDFRLRALLPTLDLIEMGGGRIILGTHLGRPKGNDKAFSTQQLIPWFTSQGYTVIFETNLDAAEIRSHQLQENEILLLENLRFFPGEQNQDTIFAQQLANLGDFYVNDAFALLHRHDSSITLVPQLFAPEKRTVGPLIINELMMLNKLLDNPAKPFVLIIGGGKVHDKIPLLKNLLHLVDTILLCPAIVATFLRALDKPVGKSLVDEKSIPLCKELMRTAHERGVSLIFPVDYIIAQDTFKGPLAYTKTDNFPANGVAMTLGTESIRLFAQYIAQAGTMFYNGAMGDSSRPETLSGMEQILKIMADAKGYSVVGGGDSVAVAELTGIAPEIDHLSTGGGATLAYLSGENLPGLQPFLG